MKKSVTLIFSLFWARIRYKKNEAFFFSNTKTPKKAAAKRTLRGLGSGEEEELPGDPRPARSSFFFLFFFRIFFSNKRRERGFRARSFFALTERDLAICSSTFEEKKTTRRWKYQQHLSKETEVMRHDLWKIVRIIPIYLIRTS